MPSRSIRPRMRCFPPPLKPVSTPNIGSEAVAAVFSCEGMQVVSSKCGCYGEKKEKKNGRTTSSRHDFAGKATTAGLRIISRGKARELAFASLAAHA